MSAKNVIIALTGFVVLVALAICAVSLFALRTVEKERDRMKTAPMREKRWAKEQQQQEGGDQVSYTPQSSQPEAQPFQDANLKAS